MSRILEVCPKCLMESGDDWQQCGEKCPIPFSPHFSTAMMFDWFTEDEIKEMFKDEVP